MRNLLCWSIIMVFLALLFSGIALADADSYIYGITIEQRALDVLTLASRRLAEARGAADAEQVISIKAKIIVSDVLQPNDITAQVPNMMFQTHIELLKARPDSIRVNLTSSIGDLQFLAIGSESLAVLPEEGVFVKTNIPQILPDSIILLDDDGGLFALINLLGGVPFGSLIRQPSIGGGGLDIRFGDVDPSDVRAVIQYQGKSKSDGGMVHVITVRSALYKQYIKIWILEDTLDLYQISIEDERGTEVFLVVEKLDMSPPPEGAFTLDTSGFAEVSEEEFLTTVISKIITSPAIEGPMAVDMFASSDRVARTGTVNISTDGFDMQDMEDQLFCEVEYRSPTGSWTPLENVGYGGLAPLGRWDAVFMPDENAELGMHSFRARYIDSSGNISEWLEALDMVMVVPAPPSVVQPTKPASGEKGVPVSTEITVAFSKPMDKKTVEKAFSMNSWSGRIIRGSLTWEENTLVFSPSTDLEYNNSYVVKITGAARDMDGLGLDGNYNKVSDGSPYDDYIWAFVTSFPSPELEFTPKDQLAYKGSKFDVKIMTKNVKGMYKFSFKAVFDPQVLEVEDVEETSFASWRPRPRYIGNADLWSETVIDNSAGFVTIACDGTRRDGVSGTGYIATVKFKAIGMGTASLKFHEVSMTDSRGNPVDVELHTAEIEVIEFHPMDVNHDGVVDILDFVAIASGKDVDSQAAPLSNQFALGQNYPNPFNPETWIPYQLARPSYVSVRIYRSTGELIRTLDIGRKEAGFYVDRAKAAYWDGMDDVGQRVSSGVYFYTIQADGFTATRKMLLCN